MECLLALGYPVLFELDVFSPKIHVIDATKKRISVQDNVK